MKDTYRETILSNYLQTHGVSISELRKYLLENFTEEFPQIAYTTLLDGLGTSKSDIDIYIITNTKNRKVYHRNLNSLWLDIEEIPFEQVKSKIDYFSKIETHVSIEDTNFDEIKLFYRIAFGVSLVEGEILNRIKAISHKIYNSIVYWHCMEAFAHFNDAARFVETENILAATLIARRGLESAAAALATSLGTCVVNIKWVYKALSQCENPEYLRLFTRSMCLDPSDTYGDSIEIVEDLLQLNNSWTNLARKNLFKGGDKNGMA